MSKVPEPLLSDISGGRCLPFIGAGFSLNASLPANLKMPDWNTLANQLALIGNLDRSQPAPIIAESYEKRFGRVQLIEAIRRALHIKKAKPGKAHLSFAMFPFDTVYTTNFDLLLEDSYTAQGRPFRSLVGELQMPFHAGQMASSIVKMHGDLRHEEHIIITKKDYDGFLSAYPVIATHFSAMLITRTPLFIGYSLTDPDFLQIRNIIKARLGNFERMAYVVQFDATDEEMEAALANQIHVISLSTKSGISRDEMLSECFKSMQNQIDSESGTRFRAARPDTFETLEKQIISDAVESPNSIPVLAATSKLCFVLMPFSEKFDAVYRNLIAPVVTELGLTVVRADELSAPGSIIEQIRVAIQQARLCIVDLTDRNPNVMYELGLAQAADKPTILISQNLDALPFDVSSQRIIKYNVGNLAAFRNLLASALQSALSGDKLIKAERLFSLGHYRAAILETSVLLEVGLRRLLEKSKSEKSRNGKVWSLRQIVTELRAGNILTQEEENILLSLTQIRNNAVHLPNESPKDDARAAISAAKQFLPKFDFNS